MPGNVNKHAPREAQLSTGVGFSLDDFFPYQVRCFYSHVATVVSQCYTEDFGMTPPEWRTMASLGPDHQLTSAQIVFQSKTDKVTVSRAVAKLVSRGWLRMQNHPTDGRVRLLQLTRAGRKVYQTLVPRVLAAEASLLEGLSANEIDALKSLIRRITSQSQSQGNAE